jgi:hypothetical protein
MRKSILPLSLLLIILCTIAWWVWGNRYYNMYWVYPQAVQEANRLNCIAKEQGYDFLWFGPSFRAVSESTPMSVVGCGNTWCLDRKIVENAEVMIRAQCAVESDIKAEQIRMMVLQDMKPCFPIRWQIQVKKNNCEEQDSDRPSKDYPLN